MMKRRIKKGMQKFLKGESSDDKKQNKKYIHESRHKHAANRPRGKDGKFLASTFINYVSSTPIIEVPREKEKRT